MRKVKSYLCNDKLHVYSNFIKSKQNGETPKLNCNFSSKAHLNISAIYHILVKQIKYKYKIYLKQKSSMNSQSHCNIFN